MKTLTLSFLPVASLTVAVTPTPKFPCTQITFSFPTPRSAAAAAIHSIRCSSQDSVMAVSDQPVRLQLPNMATPWLMLPSVTDETTGDTLDCFYSLADGQTARLNRKRDLHVPNAAICIASTIGGWLGYVDTKDGRVYLSNPFLNDVVELPSLEKLPLVLGVRRDPITNDIVHFKVRKSIYSSSWGQSELDWYGPVTPEDMVYDLSNLALSNPDPRGCDCVVMALQCDPYRSLAYCPISQQFDEDTEFDFDKTARRSASYQWTGLQQEYVHFPGLSNNQMVYDEHRNLFYAMYEDSGILAFDVHRDRGQLPKMVYNFREETLVIKLRRAFEEKEGSSEALKELRNRCRRKCYLVTLDNGDLLLIVRHYEVASKGRNEYFSTSDPHKTLHFDVFRVVYSGDLERVTSLSKDRAVFIGWNQSFCIKAGSCPGVRPNCIYFTDDVNGACNNVHCNGQWGHDMGIFSVEDGTVTSFYPYKDEQEEKKVPLSTPLFWVAPLPDCGWNLARERGIDPDKLAQMG